MRRNRIRAAAGLLLAAMLLFSVSCAKIPKVSESTVSDTVSPSVSSFVSAVTSADTSADAWNEGSVISAQGTLTSIRRASSGSLTAVLETADASVQVYLPASLNADSYSFSIGEVYRVRGVCRFYKGDRELVLQDRADMVHDGAYQFDAVTVTDVIDGDTIRVRMPSGETEKIRIIGVDTPETAKNGDPGEFYADEATAQTERLIGGTTVYLERDNTDRDDYGRLLRYVWLDLPEQIDEDTFLQLNLSAVLVRDGYAEAIRVGDNDKYAGALFALEDSAVEKETGMWAK